MTLIDWNLVPLFLIATNNKYWVRYCDISHAHASAGNEKKKFVADFRIEELDFLVIKASFYYSYGQRNDVLR